MASMTADQIASMFVERLPAGGGWISAKQATWLVDVFRRELEAAGHEYRREHGRRWASGNLVPTTAGGWDLTVAPNGAGMLKTR